MRLGLKNIGPWPSAEIRIDGITVVAGENNTGKSTLGKALYASLFCLNNLSLKIREARQNFIEEALDNHLVSTAIPFKTSDKKLFSRLSKELVKLRVGTEVDIDKIPAVIQGQKNTFKDTEKLYKSIERILSISDDQLIRSLARAIFSVEFDNQIQTVGSSNYSIELTMETGTTIFNFYKNPLESVVNPIELDRQPIYFDDSISVALENDSIKKPYHSYCFRRLLTDKNLESDPVSLELRKSLGIQAYTEVCQKLELLCQGKLQFDENNHTFIFSEEKKTNNKLSFTNLASGLKILAILQKLLLDLNIKQGSTLILDEPECHLHPEWQIALSEIIVLLQRALDLHVLVTTHSPYFVMALETYTQKYKSDKKDLFYFSKLEASVPALKDVTNEIRVIYNSLSRPLQKIEDERIAEALEN